MSLKKQLTYLKEAKKLAKPRKIEYKSKILVEDTSFLLEDKSIKDSQILRNNTSCYKIFNLKKNNDSKDNIKIINNSKDVLEIDIFTKLLKATQDSSIFKSYKILFLHGFYLFT